MGDSIIYFWPLLCLFAGICFLFNLSCNLEVKTWMSMLTAHTIVLLFFWVHWLLYKQMSDAVDIRLYFFRMWIKCSIASFLFYCCEASVSECMCVWVSGYRDMTKEKIYIPFANYLLYISSKTEKCWKKGDGFSKVHFHFYFHLQSHRLDSDAKINFVSGRWLRRNGSSINI